MKSRAAKPTVAVATTTSMVAKILLGTCEQQLVQHVFLNSGAQQEKQGLRSSFFNRSFRQRECCVQWMKHLIGQMGHSLHKFWWKTNPQHKTGENKLPQHVQQIATEQTWNKTIWYRKYMATKMHIMKVNTKQFFYSLSSPMSNEDDDVIPPSFLDSLLKNRLPISKSESTGTHQVQHHSWCNHYLQNQCNVHSIHQVLHNSMMEYAQPNLQQHDHNKQVASVQSAPSINLQ